MAVRLAGKYRKQLPILHLVDKLKPRAPEKPDSSFPLFVGLLANVFGYLRMDRRQLNVIKAHHLILKTNKYYVSLFFFFVGTFFHSGFQICLV